MRVEEAFYFKVEVLLLLLVVGFIAKYLKPNNLLYLHEIKVDCHYY